MSFSLYENSLASADGGQIKRNPFVLAALLSSLSIHLVLGWYALQIIRDIKIHVPRRPLEFNLVKPPEPIVTPPQPLPISPVPRTISPQPKPKVAVKEAPAPKPTVKPQEAPKPETMREPVKPAEIEEAKTESSQSVPLFPQSEETGPFISPNKEGTAAEPSTQGVPSEHSGNASSNTVSSLVQGNAGELTGPIFDADYLKNPIPPYPSAARKLKLQGTVIVRVLVNSQGKPEIIQLAQSSGASVLDGAALKAVKDWSFVPAREGSKPVSAWVDVPIRFRLN